ncbi:MAG: Fe-S cluster assembly protein SufD [Gammaproteobacteria bacterium]|nr:MAG: Fe-S cluster assembly protein SufD [Gammaproteobacteria bacterium]
MNASVLPQDALREHIQIHGRLLAEVPDALSNLHQAGRKQLQDQALPHRRLEAWRYTSIFPLVEADALTRPLEDADPAPARVNAVNQIVFVNGLLSRVALEDSGLSVRTWAELDDEEQTALIKASEAAQRSGEHPLAVVNQALASEAILIELDDSTELQHPLVIEYQCQGDESGSAHPRVWLQAGRFARADVVEIFSQQAAGQLHNSVTHIQLDAEARLTHTLITPESDGFQVHGIHASLARSSRLEVMTFATGAALRRLDLNVRHAGEGGELVLNGVYLTRETRHFDVRTVVDHTVPHCETDEIWRGIVTDESRAIFNGRIHIHPHAQQTRAEMNNNNLLLSDRAEVDTKPELEIYADDVKCAHGATVGRLDDTALYYFQTRGIDRKTAYRMLSAAFVQEVIDDFPDTPGRALATQLADQFHLDTSEQA